MESVLLISLFTTATATAGTCDFQGSSPYWHPSPRPGATEKDRTLFDVYPGSEGLLKRVLNEAKASLPNRTLAGLGVSKILRLGKSGPAVYEFKDLCAARRFLERAHDDHPDSVGLPLDEDSKCRNTLSLFLIGKPPASPRVIAITGREQERFQNQPESPRCSNGLREGVWILTSPDGSARESVVYRAGVRVP